jgi:hypothetical protein
MSDRCSLERNSSNAKHRTFLELLSPELRYWVVNSVLKLSKFGIKETAS